MVKEEFLHFVWKYRLFVSDYLHYRGDKITVIEPGLQNPDSGPDFFNARIRIGATVWAGNVEIHVKSSDWYKHGHQNDPAYDGVILHMVMDEDGQVFRQSGEEIPQGRLVISPSVLEKYGLLMEERENRICYSSFDKLDKVRYRDWIGKLGFTRLERRVIMVDHILKENHYDWEDTQYQVLAGAIGMRVNREPFSLLSRSVPYTFLVKNKLKPVTLHAAFFGQAGFLSNPSNKNPYFTELSREYDAIKKLLPPVRLAQHLFKKKGNRPSGFPGLRILQLAEIVRKNVPIFQKVTGLLNAPDLKKMLGDCMTDIYGKENAAEHFGFPLYKPGASTLDSWVINGIVPVLFRFGQFRKDEILIQSSLDILEELPPESNEILKKWNTFGVNALNSFESQALIELKTNYCIKMRCTECVLGHFVIQNADTE